MNQNLKPKRMSPGGLHLQVHYFSRVQGELLGGQNLVLSVWFEYMFQCLRPMASKNVVELDS